MLSAYKGKNQNELYLGDDGLLKCKCDVCNEEMNFSDTYCYAKKGKPMIHGHKRCVISYGRSE